MANATMIDTKANLSAMKAIINSQEMQRRASGILGASSQSFLASVLDLYADKASPLIECNPNEVMQEALKAAVMHLPVVKSLGFAYVVPFRAKDGKQHPQFILGYKGYIQMALRTGQYRTINAGTLYEGETVSYNRITGEITITGEAKSDKAVGYFAYFALVNGFEKSIYWPREQVVRFAEKRSRSYKSASSPWQTDFDAMAEKTLLRAILRRYGILSVEMQDAMNADEAEQEAPAPERLQMPGAIPAEAEIAEQPAPVQDAPAPEVPF